jgi:nicotinamide-nucleotide amidase
MERIMRDFIKKAGAIMTPSQEEVENSIVNIRTKIRDYVASSGLKSLVIGVSGGLDSAVVAALCQEKYTGVPLIGVSIPLSSSNEHKKMAQWVGDNYCSAFMEVNSWEEEINGITPHEAVNQAVSAIDQVAIAAGFNPDNFDTHITQGNIKARLRMITVYDLARKIGGCVLSTDNYSELWTGFFTLHGDHNDLGVIQFIEKYWEERPIAEALGIRADIIGQAPSDGLGVTENNTDEAQLGISYRELGPVIFAYENRFPEDIQEMFEEVKNIDRVQNIIKRHNASKFKIEWPHFIMREDIGFPEHF